MSKFEYVPQLIIAYDGDKDDQFASLIHVSKAEPGRDYYCPCCGQPVRAIGVKGESVSVQPHYRHMNSECPVESRLHFFIKNWLFEKGSKFYLEKKLYEVESLDIEKMYDTPFGKYKPDVTVYTTDGNTIYFEMYFQNRKTESNYYCKWQYLNHDVVEVNVAEYFMKADLNDIPKFKYLYHDGECFCKPYAKRDLYFNVIGKLKHSYSREQLIKEKRQLELLDRFWIKISESSNIDEILEILNEMDYKELETCYQICKRKQCVKTLAPYVLKIIDDKILEEIKQRIHYIEQDNIKLVFEYKTSRTLGFKLLGEYKDKVVISCVVRFKDDQIVFKSKIHNVEEIESLDFKKLEEDVNLELGVVRDNIDKYILFEEEINNLQLDDTKYVLDGEYIHAVIKVEGKNYPIESFKHFHDLEYVKNYLISEKKNIINELKVKAEYEQYIISEDYINKVNEIKKYATNLNLKASVQVTYDEHYIKVHLYIYTKEVEEHSYSNDWLTSFKKCLLFYYKDKQGYKYYIDKLDSSGLFKTSIFMGRYQDIGIKIEQKIDLTEDIAPYRLYIRDNDDIRSIDNKFKKAIITIKEELEDTGNIGFYKELS